MRTYLAAMLFSGSRVISSTLVPLTTLRSAGRGYHLACDAVHLIESMGPQVPLVRGADEHLQGQGLRL